MSQQRLGAANQAIAEAKAQQMSAIGDVAGSAADLVTAGMGRKALKDKKIDDEQFMKLISI